MYTSTDYHTLPISSNSDIFSSAKGDHHKPCDQQSFQPTDHIPVLSTGPLGGNQIQDLNHQSQALTTHLGL
jgi:hypothetical protein